MEKLNFKGVEITHEDFCLIREKFEWEDALQEVFWRWEAINEEREIEGEAPLRELTEDEIIRAAKIAIESIDNHELIGRYTTECYEDAVKEITENIQ